MPARWPLNQGAPHESPGSGHPAPGRGRARLAAKATGTGGNLRPAPSLQPAVLATCPGPFQRRGGPLPLRGLPVAVTVPPGSPSPQCAPPLNSPPLRVECRTVLVTPQCPVAMRKREVWCVLGPGASGAPLRPDLTYGRCQTLKGPAPVPGPQEGGPVPPAQEDRQRLRVHRVPVHLQDHRHAGAHAAGMHAAQGASAHMERP